MVLFDPAEFPRVFAATTSRSPKLFVFLDDNELLLLRDARLVYTVK